jgi:von Willebrand factor type A domain
MRPEGCQETGRAPAAISTARKLQISNHFDAHRFLTVSKRETYTGPMTRRRARLAACLLVALVSATPGRLGAQARQRALYVSALNEAGQPVPGLGPSDFIVREDNVAREVLRVEPATEPMQVALLVDNSQAAREAIQFMRTALPSFITEMTEGPVRSTVAIISTGERPTVLTDYTANPAMLQKATDRIWSYRGTGAYLLDAIVETCDGFRKKEARRPVIVAVSIETGPELSSAFYDRVRDKLRNVNAALYVLPIGQPNGSLQDEMRERARVLDEGTRLSGGRRDDLLTPMGLDAKLKQLANELTHMYLVTYAHPESLIPPDKVTITAAKPGVTARGTLVRENTSTGKK